MSLHLDKVLKVGPAAVLRLNPTAIVLPPKRSWRHSVPLLKGAMEDAGFGVSQRVGGFCGGHVSVEKKMLGKISASLLHQASVGNICLS
jgi:hypothetical protein